MGIVPKIIKRPAKEVMHTMANKSHDKKSDKVHDKAFAQTRADMKDNKNATRADWKRAYQDNKSSETKKIDRQLERRRRAIEDL